MGQQEDHGRNQKYLERNENADTILQNLWGPGKAILRGKFIALQAHLKKTRKSSNKQSDFTLTGTSKRTTNKPKVSRRKEIKIRAKINEIESKT